MRSLRLLALVAVLGAALPAALEAQRVFAPIRQTGSGGFSYSAYGGHGEFAYGGHGFSHSPPYPYPAPPPQQQRHVVLVLEATHDWRFWSPTTLVFTGPLPAEYQRPSVAGNPPTPPCAAASGERVIGMGIPRWERSAPPLGEVARRYREVPRTMPAILVARN